MVRKVGQVRGRKIVDLSIAEGWRNLAARILENPAWRLPRKGRDREAVRYRAMHGTEAAFLRRYAARPSTRSRPFNKPIFWKQRQIVLALSNKPEGISAVEVILFEWAGFNWSGWCPHKQHW